MTTSALSTTTRADLLPADLLSDFGAFLRLQVADGDASPHTIRSYLTNARQYATWCAERGIEPARATENNLLLYRQYLAGCYGRGTVAVKLAAGRRLYEGAVWRGFRQDNPAAGLKAPKDKTEQAERAKFLPLDGLRRLLSAPIGNKPGAVRDRAMLALMGRHGLRVSEVCGLRLEDVTIRERSGKVNIHAGKGNTYREVPINRDARLTISEWLKVRPEDKGPHLFTGRRHHQLRPRAVQRFLDKLARRAGLDPAEVTPHVCRHTFGKNLVDLGESLDRVAKLMGHKDLSTTAIYTTPSRADLAAAVEKLAWQD